MITTLIPGWGVPPTLYRRHFDDFNVLDLGFFSDEAVDLMETPRRVEALGDEVALVGHSLGALLAIQSALLLDHVKALVLMSGFARFAEDEGYPGQSIKPIKAMRLQLRLGPRGLLGKFHQAMTHPETLDLPVPSTIDASALSKGLDVLIEYDYRDRLGEIGVPVLLLHGWKDQIAAPPIAREMAAKLPKSRLEMFEGAGHALPLTRGESCRALINEFLSGVE